MILEIPAMAVLHGTCAGLYAILAALILLRRQQSRTGFYLALAALLTAAWALSVAVWWRTPLGLVPRSLELVRAAAWYGFILHLYRRGLGGRQALTPAFVTMGLLALLVVGGMPLLDLLFLPTPGSTFSLLIASRLVFAVGTLLLIENLYRNSPEDERWHINLLCVALGGLALYDLLLYADAALFRRVSWELFIGRASVTALAAPLIALAAVRNRRWDINIHVSRQAVFHSATLVISGVFLLGLAVVGEVFRRTGAEWGLVAEVTLVFAGLLATAVLLTSGSGRARLRNLVVDHFFSLRYDYRRQWMQCIETLSAPEAYVGLHTRAARALAEVVDSPAGALYVRDPEEVAFRWAGSWNLPAATAEIPPGHPLVAAFRDGDWIVDLDAIPAAREWFAELPRVWLAVPLNHLGHLLGFVVLTRSRAPFKLDREVFELLRVISREVAGRVAEQRAVQVLQQTRELREYSQRFAFVVHDIKNVSGQLTMLLANAERHADNPEFQRDMLVTVRASVARITRLLARLAAGAQERTHALIEPAERIGDVVAAFRRASGAVVTIEGDGGEAGVAIDPDAFDAVVTHLLTNAVEATNGASDGPGNGPVDGPGDRPGDRMADGTGGGAGNGANSAASAVRVVLRHEALSVLIDIVDEGPGMSSDFIRDRLFRPFATTKTGGHGIGAYQARELLRAAGGDLLVLSRPGAGTTMRLLLPSVRVPSAETSSVSA
ncbi:MAG TPA: XrtA/PEP-CTERM system histidine kinase PrsK [Acetobacteraceae bacterium]|nr:XrtA/PEP-CTERM system histidine kinase PrsK [Acetobacteraceae bacterium]